MNDEDVQENTNPMPNPADNALPEDNSTPSSPPDGTVDRIDDTHPATDTNIDPSELYDEGIEGAAEVSPGPENAVVNAEGATENDADEGADENVVPAEEIVDDELSENEA